MTFSCEYLFWFHFSAFRLSLTQGLFYSRWKNRGRYLAGRIINTQPFDFIKAIEKRKQ